MTRLIDVSHVIEAGMVTYRGLPGPIVSDYLGRDASRSRYASGTTFQIGRIEMIANTGTYVDAPFHRFAEGADLSELPLSSVADLEGTVVRVGERTARAIGPEVLSECDMAGKAVLVHTGWDVHWRTDGYFEGHPFLTRDAVESLVRARPALVGIDSMNIDDDADGTRPAHTQLLGAGIPVVEHLCNLGALPDTGFRFFAVPVKVKAMGSFPVRAFGLVA